jgi:hypothetical protein
MYLIRAVVLSHNQYPLDLEVREHSSLFLLLGEFSSTAQVTKDIVRRLVGDSNDLLPI